MTKLKQLFLAQFISPHISIFLGDTGKGEVSYAQWLYEVKCLMF